MFISFFLQIFKCYFFSRLNPFFLTADVALGMANGFDLVEQVGLTRCIYEVKPNIYQTRF